MYNDFTIEEVRELIKADIMSLREYSQFFQMPFSTVAWTRRNIGIKKQDFQRWTPIQIKWLEKLYTWMGDYEIALIFTEAYEKKNGWTLKHIEKKRQYLGLKRTKKELRVIKKRNYDFGSWAANLQRLHEERKAPTGTVRVWGDREYIRTESGNESLARYLWKQSFGDIPNGFNVVRKNKSLPITIENIECISNAELAKRNSFYNYPYELRQAIISLNKLNKQLYEKHQ